MKTERLERLRSDELFDQRAETLALSLSDEPFWSLPITLLWIAYRDLHEAAGLALRWAAIKPELQSSGLLEFLRIDLEDGGGRAFSAQPDCDLSAALRRGQVQALGCLNGKAASASIPAEAWNGLHFVDHPSSSAGRFSACVAPEVSDAEFWSDVRFERGGLLNTFSAGDALHAVTLAQRKVRKADVTQDCVRRAVAATGVKTGEAVAYQIVLRFEGHEAAKDQRRVNSVRTLLGQQGFTAEELRKL